MPHKVTISEIGRIYLNHYSKTKKGRDHIFNEIKSDKTKIKNNKKK